MSPFASLREVQRFWQSGGGIFLEGHLLWVVDKLPRYTVLSCLVLFYRGHIRGHVDLILVARHMCLSAELR